VCEAEKESATTTTTVIHLWMKSVKKFASS
jgi:hypothetical protein